MDVDEAYRHLFRHLQLDSGRFFARDTGLSLGAGQLYAGVTFPIFDDENKLYLTAEGLVYVLTHECDIDQSNIRPYNSHVLICPIIDFREFVDEFQGSHSEEHLRGFLSDLGKRKVSRLVYLPHIYPQLPYGGLLYLNRITHTHVSSFGGTSVSMICTVTPIGLREVDYALTNSLLRPKVEPLPLQGS